MRVVPSEAVANVSIAMVRDFRACPYRFYRAHLETDPNLQYPPLENVDRIAQRVVRDLIRAREATSARAHPDDVLALTQDFAGELGQGAEVAGAAARAAWAFWSHLEAEGATILSTDIPFGLALEDTGGPWTLSGLAPLVTRFDGERPRASILRVLSFSSADNDLEAGILGTAATEILRLEAPTVDIFLSSSADGGDPFEHGAPWQVDRFTIEVDPQHWRRSLTVATGLRQSIRDALTGTAFAFTPNRAAVGCHRGSCPHVSSCESAFGGQVASAP